MRRKPGLMAEECRAIGADDFFRIAHVEEDVWVIERWRGTDALEFLGANLDDADAGRVVKMRNDVIRHGAIHYT
jgi:hypothetical protein